MTDSTSKLETSLSEIVELLYDRWDEIDGLAQHQGHLYQDDDAAYECHLDELRKLLRPKLKQLVFDCADICLGRAKMHGDRTYMRQEAWKCAAQVRNNMLAVTGVSSVCIHCDGKGCDKCDDGIYHLTRSTT